MKRIINTNRIEASQTARFAASQSAAITAPAGDRFWQPRFASKESISLARLPKPPLRLPSKDLLGQPLSPREKQVLRLIALGETYVAVATDLGLTKKMVDRHVTTIHRKLGAHCVAHLVHYALANGEVDLLFGPGEGIPIQAMDSPPSFRPSRQ